MAKTHLKLVTPATKKRAVTPKRQPNSELRSREHLTETEVDKLIEAGKGNRYGHRYATRIIVASRWPYRLPFPASISLSTSVSVRCSRLRSSLFGCRFGVTARFLVAGVTSFRCVLAMVFTSCTHKLLV